MESPISINPFRVRLWDLHDRLEEHISEETCRAEIESFAKHGQLVPALGRRLKANPDFDVELIYGARRLFVARHINVPLLVELRDLSDQEAIVAMDVENRQRKDISPYERGIAYTRWLRTGFFSTQEDIARTLGVSASQISRLVKLARLPAALVDAFGTAINICEEWGISLVDSIDDSHRRPAVISKAREIARQFPRPPANEVYRQLQAAAIAGRKPKPLMHDQVVRGKDGTPLFRITQRRDCYAILLPNRGVTGEKLRQIQTALVNILAVADEQERRHTLMSDAAFAAAEGQ